MLTEDILDIITDIAQQASPGPVCVFFLPESSSPGEWIIDCLSKNMETTVYGVALETSKRMQETGEAMPTAITGNGPTSEANAIFYATCHTAVPALLEECRRLRRLLDTRDVLPATPAQHPPLSAEGGRDVEPQQGWRR